MSVQLDRIKKMLSTMYNSENNNSKALDEGIRSVSNFYGANDLVNSIVIEANHYKLKGVSADTFLLDRCGINLNNEDIGAITGADVGGVLKTADSVVPEYSDERKWLSSDTTSDIGSNLIIKWPADVIVSMNAKRDSGAPGEAYTAEERIISGLYSWWISEGLKLVEESTGGNLAMTGKTWTLNIIFKNTTNNTTRIDTNNQNNDIKLYIDIGTFKDILIDKNGYNSAYRSYYFDRLVSHELTHAILTACLEDKYIRSYRWFIEGMAELTCGKDDYYVSLREVANDTSSLLSGFHEGQYYLGNGYEYCSGYIALRYLAHSGGSQFAGSTFMESAQAYYSDDFNTLIAKGNISGEVWLDNQHGTAFVGSVNNIDASSCNGSNNILAGNIVDNVILAGSGATSLWGGVGGNDTLQGGAALDMFWYGKGEENDVILNSSMNDTVNLYNISVKDITSTDISSSNISLNFRDGWHLSVQGSDRLSSAFVLGADNTAWRYNHDSQSWQQG